MAGSTILKDISPPPRRRTAIKSAVAARQSHAEAQSGSVRALKQDDEPSLAAIEAGDAVINDHLDYFASRLAAAQRPTPAGQPRLSIEEYRSLYLRNQRASGTHFVVHQHDHPIAGVHYDLRLQFSATSAISFAIPYGLPGNPVSIRPNRMAIETRVHNLWNNLIESASHATGSLLIWDTGEYEVLPYREEPKEILTDDEGQEHHSSNQANVTDSECLYAAFQDKHIRLRLHGRRLPPGYTISLRLPKNNRHEPKLAGSAKKRRRLHQKSRTVAPASSESEECEPQSEQEPRQDEVALASDVEEDAAIRANNAYTGATNSIGSVHQRHWFLSLDKVNSGFSAAALTGEVDAPKPFFVMGRDVERSVVTGRSADDVMSDEGVQAFVGRKMWRPITE